jgi:DNA mismatch repair ATPase MutS
LARRELKSVLTGGTIVDGSMLTDDMSNHCVAIKVRESENSAVEASRTQTPNEGGDVGVGVSSCKERHDR